MVRSTCSMFDPAMAKGVAKGDLNPHTLKAFASPASHTTATAAEQDTELVKQQQEYLAQFSKGLPQTSTLDKFVTTARRPSQSKRTSSSSSLHLPVSQRAKSGFRAHAGNQSKSEPSSQDEGGVQLTEVKSKYFGLPSAAKLPARGATTAGTPPCTIRVSSSCALCSMLCAVL